MRVIAKPTLSTYWQQHADAEQPLKAWYDEVAKATWQSPHDIKPRYPSVSFVANNRVIFNIKGNHYRLVAAVSYRYAAVYIKFVGTHAEYDKFDPATVERS